VKKNIDIFGDSELGGDVLAASCLTLHHGS
jgi:hypothetical protein